MDRRTALYAFAGGAAAALAGCRRTSSRLRAIRVVTIPRFILAPLYLADELGFFRDEGLLLDVTLITQTTQMIPLLAAGQADVTFGGATPAVFNAVSQGARIRIVAARDQAVTGCTNDVHGNRDSFPNGFGNAAALRGKRVAVSAETSLSAFLLDVLLDSAGLGTRDVTVCIMGLSESALALVARRIDAVVDIDMGFSSPLIVAGPSVAALLPGFQYSYVHFGPRFVGGDVAEGAAFIRAYFRGVHEFRLGRTPQAIDELAMGSGMSRAAVVAACRVRLPEDGRVDVSSVQRMADWSMRKQFTRGRTNAQDVIDARFIETAHRS